MEKNSTGNRKIVNATPMQFNGIQFKSRTEVMVYKLLSEYGFKPDYEGKTFTIWQGFTPSIPFYTKTLKGKAPIRSLVLSMKKLLPIHYTPDFIVKAGKYTAIIEVKGYENDVFPMKFKIFRKYLETRKGKYVIFEVFNKKMALQMIDKLKELKKGKDEQEF